MLKDSKILKVNGKQKPELSGPISQVGLDRV